MTDGLRYTRWLGAVLLLAGLLAGAAFLFTMFAPQRQAFPFADLGETTLLSGGGSMLVLVLADDATQQPAVNLGMQFARSGINVGLVNIDRYLANVAQHSPECMDAVTLLDVYAQALQKQLHSGAVSRPVLLGLGKGASYLPILLQGAPAGLFQQGISVEPAEPVALPAPPCSSPDGWHSPQEALRMPHPVSIATPWKTVSSSGEAADNLLAQIRRVRGAGLPDLPLVELPVASGTSPPYLAIVLSGDGGWANIDKDIGGALVARGIPVVGWNSLKYFWQPGNPDALARDLRRVIAHYTERWHTRRVLLVGFSLGADVLPFGVSKLSGPESGQLVGMVLLSPSRYADFQFHVTDWLGSSPPSANYALASELSRLPDLPVLCIYGVDDDEGACPALENIPRRQVVQLPGDHHFDGDYQRVTELVLQQFPVASP